MLRYGVWLLVFAAIGLAGVKYWRFENSIWHRIKNPETVQKLKRYIAVNEGLAYAVTNVPLTEVRPMFQCAEEGNWVALDRAVERAKKNINYRSAYGNGFKEFGDGELNFVSKAWRWLTTREENDQPRAEPPPRPDGVPWVAIKEVCGALKAFMTVHETYCTQFGNEVFGSIPPGSIYFSGTETGRGIVSVLSRSFETGDPFFIIGQDQLADQNYRDYLHSMFGGKMYLPTEEDAGRCFKAASDKLMAQIEKDHGLHAHQDYQGRWSADFMSIPEQLTSFIFEKNPQYEFYVEEGIPLNWAYPYLEPHGLILKLNRQPVGEIAEEAIRQDAIYWAGQLRSMVGDWVYGDTKVEQIAKFAKSVYGWHDLSDFNGDLKFVQSPGAQRLYSKSRCSIAGLYEWRAQHAKDDTEKKRMNAAADFAFRQALALCPYSTEPVYRYINFLAAQGRIPDAILVGEMAAKLMEDKDAAKFLQEQVESLQKR